MVPFRLIAGFCCLFFGTVTPSPGQQNLWKDIQEADIQATPADRLIIPNRYRALALDFAKMQSLLQTAPSEQEYLLGESGLLLDFPMPDGRMTRFEVWEAPVMAPELTVQYPDIRSFSGKNVTGNGMIARFDISRYGFHALLLSTGEGSVYIDPYARGNTGGYICYYRKDFSKKTGDRMICEVDDTAGQPHPGPGVSDRAGDCGNLRKYRLALACTGEYANFHGATGTNKAPALAAMNTSMTRVNGVYERDVSVRMIIVANNTDIIYTDPASDPYTNNNGSTMLGQNQTTCDNVIGSSNYDIGHVFSTGGGGVAYLSCVCNASLKAGGVTGSPSPVGDAFDIDYVAHEMGHQFGANHTQYNNCNRNNSTAMEPGSASTIMGYAGICSPNVQNNSDDYFHAVSLGEIGTFVTGSGNSCAVLQANGNTAPVAATLSNYTIPKSTPFLLGGSATDANGDALTYCWEQTNAYSAPAQTMPPASTNTSGPVFRSLQPVTAATRYFPNFDAVLANTTPTWEVLPSVGRTLSFRMTVRDNHANGGCTTEKNMTVTVNSASGPFRVTAPDGGESYPSGSTQTVTWNVASTSGSPVNCANVNIWLSTDGGTTFSTLVGNTPNDGTQSVTFNVSPTSTARIKVQAVGNVFYDVSNNNFTIAQPLPVELLHFDARWADTRVQLDWATASESDNRGFAIERSAGDAASFREIGWIDGHGTTALRHAYSFQDAAVRPGTLYYYRLKQQDNSGVAHYSDLRAVETGLAAGQLAVSPNPVRDVLRLVLQDDAVPEGQRAVIFNAAGQLVLEAHLPATELDVQGLPPGVYYVQRGSARARWVKR